MANSLTKAQKALLKTLKFPCGGDVTVFGREVAWSKRGGHAGGSVMNRVAAAAGEAGFKQVDSFDSSTPDASRVGGGLRLVDAAGTRLELISSYGVTSYENHYSITLTFAPSQE